MKIVVLKFGGTSVGNIKKIKRVAKIIIDYKKRKYKVIVVSSAMSGVTIDHRGTSGWQPQFPSASADCRRVDKAENFVASALHALWASSAGKERLKIVYDALPFCVKEAAACIC